MTLRGAPITQTTVRIKPWSVLSRSSAYSITASVARVAAPSPSSARLPCCSRNASSAATWRSTPMTPAGTTCRISATALRKARPSRRPPIAGAVLFGIVRRCVTGRHLSVLVGSVDSPGRACSAVSDHDPRRSCGCRLAAGSGPPEPPKAQGAARLKPMSARAGSCAAIPRITRATIALRAAYFGASRRELTRADKFKWIATFLCSSQQE